MKTGKAVVIGGLLAGLVTTAAMVAGRKSGVLGKTLDRDSVDWIDRNTGSRAVIGDAGTSAVELANHLGASVGFAALYPPLRRPCPTCLRDSGCAVRHGPLCREYRRHRSDPRHYRG